MPTDCMSEGELTINSSVVSGNSSGRWGGGIYVEDGNVTLHDSVVDGNTGANAGGGIYTADGNVTLNRSMVHRNSSTSRGGGIVARSLGGNISYITVIDSALMENTSNLGGGIYTRGGSVLLDASTVSGNSSVFHGGGVYAGYLTLVGSTVSGNSSGGGDGGGIHASQSVTLSRSTVSGNYSGDVGGGIFAKSDLMLENSTVAGNSSGVPGGGIYAYDGSSIASVTIQNSIVAGNSAYLQWSDLRPDPDGLLYIDFSLIGDNDGTGLGETQTPDANGNLIGSASGAGVIDPRLAPLGDNGGPTHTHALMPGSPAIDAGNSTLTTDQRGLPVPADLPEVPNTAGSNGSDMGAFERQVARCDIGGDGACDLDDIDAIIMEVVAGTDDPFLDLTGDGLVDLADRDLWLADAGLLNLPSGNAFLLGDANLDGVVDGQDFVVWNASKFTTTGKWSQGDWDADGATDGRDFILWNANKFQGAIVVDRSAIQRAHANVPRLFDRDADRFAEVRKIFVVD